MKKTAISLLLLCGSIIAMAQIDNRGHWYDGNITYSAEDIGNKNVKMSAMNEGEELEFILRYSHEESPGTEVYTVANGNPDHLNVHEVGTTVRHQKAEGWDVICFYDSENRLKTVMSKESEWDAEKLNKARWTNQLIGEYISEEESEFEKQIHWEWNGVAINGIIYPYKIVTFNGGITGHITIEHVEGAPNEMEGTWEVQPTLEGLLFSAVYTDDDTMPWQWTPTGFECLLREVNPGVGRFFYASSTLLNDKQFARLDKPSLRIMRNAILARHGYRFQSKDLQDYFSAEPWYKPAASNDNIRLSFIEQLNMQLISWEEAQNDE